MKKAFVFAALFSIPVLWIAVREGVRYVASQSDPAHANPAALFYLLGAGMTLIPLWTGLILYARMRRRRRERGMPMDVAAAIAMEQARKRPPSRPCPSCGRPRIAEGSPRCLYCGAPAPVEPVM